MSRMPAAFIGHGSPMNTLERNRYTEAWRAFGASIEKPRAVLAISAHWYINATAVTVMPKPRTIHDFYGFPQALFDVQYPASGLPELGEEIAEIVKPVPVGMDADAWGLDHGTWSVLSHVFPEADVPVVQLSINALKPFDYHFELGMKLAALRERGVLILGSGNVVHNLRRIAWDQPDAAFDWNERFDEAAKQVMTERPQDAVKLREHPDYLLASPTPDHFIPLLYVAGVAAASSEPAGTLVEGYSMGSLSMTSYGVGTSMPKAASGEGAAAAADRDMEQTNI